MHVSIASKRRFHGICQVDTCRLTERPAMASRRGLGACPGSATVGRRVGTGIGVRGCIAEVAVGATALGAAVGLLASGADRELPAVAAKLVLVVAGLDPDLVAAAGERSDEADRLDADARRDRLDLDGLAVQEGRHVDEVGRAADAGADDDIAGRQRRAGAGWRPVMIGARPGDPDWRLGCDRRREPEADRRRSAGSTVGVAAQRTPTRVGGGAVSRRTASRRQSAGALARP